MVNLENDNYLSEGTHQVTISRQSVALELPAGLTLPRVAPETAEFQQLLLRNGYAFRESRGAARGVWAVPRCPIFPEISADFGLRPALSDNFESVRGEKRMHRRFP